MLLGFASFPVFTRVFSVSDYGAMSLVLKVILLLTVLGKFGLQNSVQRYYAEQTATGDAGLTRRYYSTLTIGAFLTGIVAALMFTVAVYLTPASLLSVNLRYLLLFASGLIVVRSLQPSLIGFLRAEGKTKSYNAIEIAVRAGSILLAIALLLYWRRTLTVFFGSTMAVEGVGVLLLGLYFGRRG